MRTDHGPSEPSPRETALVEQLRHVLIENKRLRTILDSRDKAGRAGASAASWSRSYWFMLGAMAGFFVTVFLLS